MVLTLHQVATAKEPIRSWLEKEWRSEEGHPDFVYTQIAWQKLKAKEKREIEKIQEALDRLKETQKTPSPPVIAELPTTTKKIFKPPQFKKYGEEAPTPLISKTIERKISSSIRRVWNEIGFSFYSFVKYVMIVLILLTLLNVLLVGKFGLLPLLLRSFGIVLLGYLTFFFYKKTKRLIPWKWVSITILVVLSAHIYSTGDYSALKIFDNLTGIEKFTDNLVQSFSKILTLENIILKPQANINIGETLFRYKSPEEILNEKVQEMRNKSSQLEIEIHRLINERRQQSGLSPLTFDERLAEVARYHSKDMALKNYFSHVAPNGEDVETRYQKFGYQCAVSYGNYIYSGAENLMLNNIVSSYSYDPLTGRISEYVFKSFDSLSSSTVDGWMRSEGHRRNILEPFWRREGIGVYVDSDGEVYITQNFC
jgi:uncharacterized protein YkwD